MVIVWRSWAAALLISTSGSAFAQQAYPNKPIRLIVPFAPGGSNDIVARIIGYKFGESFGQQVIIDNRGGASGIIGTDLAAKATPDGYTLLMMSLTLAVNPSLYKKLPYDTEKDLIPVSLVASAPLILVVHPSLPVKSARELIALARSRPGEINYAAGSLGAAPHLDAELFKAMGKLNIVRVAYKGTGGSLIGILSGEVGLMFPTAGSVTPYIKAGKLRALAVTSLQPTALAPGLPLLSESLPGYESVSLNGMLAPARTPDNIIRQINAEVAKVMTRADIKEKLVAAGTDAMSTSPEEFAAIIRTDMAKWGKVIREAGIRE